MTELSIVGKPTPSIDGVEKCTGQTKFASDLRFPGMLHGKVLRSPYPHARILSIDTSRAERILGVRAVITAKNCPSAKYGQIVPDELPLAADRVRFVGEAVAAVAAIDEETADEALDLIKVEYEVLPAVFDPVEAMKEGAPRIHEHCENNVVLRYEITRGECEEALLAADFVAEERFVTSMVHQAYLEPVVCVVDFAGGHLTAWLPVQSAHSARGLLATAMSMPVSHVRVIQPSVGGGFGGKNEHRIYVICALLAKKTGKKVRMIHSHKEEMTCGLPRVPMIIDLKMGAKRDGTLVGKKARIIADNGAYTNLAPPVLSVAAMRPDTMYRVSNLKTEAILVYTNKLATGTFRGFGNPQMTFAVESMVDMLAEKAGIDPVEMRLRNATQAGDVSAHGYIVRSCGLSDCINSAAAASAWRGKKAERKVGRGIGMACCVHVNGNRAAFPMFDGSAAMVKIGNDGMVRVISGEPDTGQGARTLFAQIAAEELGIGIDQVTVEPVDTEISPFGLGNVSSRVTFLGGNAVKSAAGDARHKLLQVAARMMETDAANLEMANGRVFVRGSPDRALAFGDIARASAFGQGGGPILGQGVFVPDNAVLPDPKTRLGNVSSAYSFGAQVAEVEVDLETGRVNVVNFIASHDIGKAINPMAVEGQVEGGVCQGVGYAISEEMILVNGVVQNTRPADYKLPTSMDMPPTQTILVETIDPVGPYGAKGIGEPALVPTAAAVINAIYDATGVRITSLPATPEKIRRALGLEQSPSAPYDR